jgi:hypothetical protein
MPSANDEVALVDREDKQAEAEMATKVRAHKRAVAKLRKKCAKSKGGVIHVSEPTAAATPPVVKEPPVPIEQCDKRVSRVWEIIKQGILDPEKHKDAWLINTAEAQDKRGKLGTVLHPKWQPAPDVYFYHDPAIDALVVLDQAPETMASNKGQRMMFGIKRTDLCCCDAPEHKSQGKFRLPMICHGDCRQSPLPHLTGTAILKEK